jgi:hypothetical protein
MFGKREMVAMSVVNYIDNHRLDLQFLMNWILKKDLRAEMKKNKALKNKHKGKRCFIVGNGPSLKHHDLTKLTDEYVFTVNYMMKSKYFETLKSNYHFLVSPIIFHLDPKNVDDLDKIESISNSVESNPDLTYFIPYRRKPSFTRLFPTIKPNCIFNNKIYTPLLKKSDEIHRNIPVFQNVIIYAINAALYMGFDEIYLMGVDMTGFLEHYEYNKVNDQWGHVYHKSKEEQKRDVLSLSESNLDNEFWLKTYGKTLEHFKLIQKQVDRKNAKIYNASEHGALDVVQRIDYESLFK